MLLRDKTKIKNTSNIFILFDGQTMIKLKKGSTSLEIKQTIGEPIKKREGQNIKNFRFYYKLKNQCYELFFLDDSLELCIKTKKIKL